MLRSCAGGGTDIASAELTPVIGGDGMRRTVLRGIAWKSVSQIVLQVSRAVVAVVIARLLAPHDYGLAAMALVFASLVLVFSDLALGAALVQRPALTEDDRSTVFWMSMAAGLTFTLVGVAASGPIADFYGEPAVRPLFAALSLAFVVTSLGTVQSALLTRTMDFRRLELTVMIGNIGGAVVGIAAALNGRGAWAIILQQLVTAGLSSLLLFFVCPWRPHLRFSLDSLRSLRAFSANVFGQRVLYYLHRNTDNLLVGRFVGASALGVYGLAYNVMLVPFTRIAGPLQEVLFPAFSRIQDDPRRIADAWIRVTRLVAALALPALVGLAIVAPDFVHIVLGPKWSEVAPVLQILVWVGLLQSLQTLNSGILIALDRTQLLFRYSLVFFAAHLVAFVVGVQFGIIGVALGYAISSTLVEPVFSWLTARALGISPLEVPRALFGVAQATVVMGVSVLAVRLVLEHAHAAPGLRLVAATLVGGLVFVAACAWRAPEVADELRRLLRRGPRSPVSTA
jgi:O-antigen/teichoic acid export membrane protein